MHIVLFNDDILPAARGGSAVVADLLRKELSARGHRVTLVTSHQDPAGPDEERRTDAHGAIISLKVIYPSGQRHRRCIRDAALSQRIATLLAEMKPDVVHAHVIHEFLTYDVLRLARAVTDRVFLTAHDTFLVSFDRIGGMPYQEAAQRGEPYRVSWWENFRASGRKYNPFRNMRIRSILKQTGTQVIAVSRSIEEFLRANGIGHVTAIHNATPPADPPSPDAIAAFRKKMNLNGPTVLFAGRVNGDKGMGMLLYAFEQVLEKIPDAQLLVAGEEKRITSLTAFREAPEAVKKAMRVTGWMDHGEMPLVYAAADVVTTPSVYLDAFNMINIEAMALGKPVVGTCFGGTAEIVVDNVTGFIVDPTNLPLFADRLRWCMADPAMCARLGTAGRKRAEAGFAPGTFVERHLALYENRLR